MEIIIPADLISNRIYVIRGQKVMLDRHLAELYEVETKRLKEQVRRNKMRFPEDFMFELTKDELEDWRSQFATSNDRMGLRVPPFAFTEHGVLMLSSILNSQKAIDVNIQIVRIFTKLRKAILDNDKLKLELSTFMELTEERFQVVFETLDHLLAEDEKPAKKIGF